MSALAWKMYYEEMNEPRYVWRTVIDSLHLKKRFGNGYNEIRYLLEQYVNLIYRVSH